MHTVQFAAMSGSAPRTPAEIQEARTVFQAQLDTALTSTFSNPKVAIIAQYVPCDVAFVDGGEALLPLTIGGLARAPATHQELFGFDDIAATFGLVTALYLDRETSPSRRILLVLAPKSADLGILYDRFKGCFRVFPCPV